MATKLSVIVAIANEVGDDISDSDVLGLYRQWFDDSLDTVLASWRWPYRRGVVEIAVDSESFDGIRIPSSVAGVRKMRRQDTHARIDFLDGDRLVEMEIDLTITGSPRFWYWTGYDEDTREQIAGLYPLPDTDFTILADVDKQTALPLADADVVPVPQEVLGVLREGIRMYAYENDGLLEMAQLAGARMQMRLRKLVELQGARRQEDAPRLREDGDMANFSQRIPLAHFPSRIPEP